MKVRDRGGGGGFGRFRLLSFWQLGRNPLVYRKKSVRFAAVGYGSAFSLTNESGLKAARSRNGLTRANVVVQRFLNASGP
jgi:hypothetical protein